jgi:desulfoferrodoxin-like iron-binding protein
MPISGQVYKCNVCDQIIRVINGTDVAPMCCEAEMELIENPAELQNVPEDKNICGTVLQCQQCNFKVIMINDEGTGIRHCSQDMKMTADRTSGEWDMIYKCSNCGQIIKITKEGCGEIHCCDTQICVMDIAQVREVKDQIEIELARVDNKPYEDQYLICIECEREIKILKKGEGKVICHDKPMDTRDRIRYYFQGGG